MKRMLCLLAIAGLVVAGCAKSKPTDVAKGYVNRLVAKHQGFKLDTSKLKYKVVEQGKDSAIVEVSGKVTVNARIPLVKKADQWVVAVPDTAAKMKAAHTAGYAHPAAAERHAAARSTHGERAEHSPPAEHKKEAVHNKEATHKAE